MRIPLPVDESLLQFEPEQISAALSMLCGKQIGLPGLSRTVYAMRYNDDYVVKFERADSDAFQNVIEFRAWNFIMHNDKLSKFFAPCMDISRCGRVLIQARTQPLPDDIELVDMPSIITDYKKMNWGMFMGQPVLHDYGLLNPVGHRVSIKKQKLLF